MLLSQVTPLSQVTHLRYSTLLFYFQDCPRLDLTRPNLIVQLDTTFDCVWVMCTSTIRTRILRIGHVTGRIELPMFCNFMEFFLLLFISICRFN